MSVTVTVVDNETGDQDQCQVVDGDYVVICVEPAYQSHVATYPRSGTHVVTIKGRTVR